MAKLPAQRHKLTDNRDWRLKFIRQLMGLPEERKDKGIRRLLLSDADTIQQTASFVELYIHNRTDWLRKDRKARGRTMKKRLHVAVAGTEVAADLFSKSGEHDKSELLLAINRQLREMLNRADGAFDTKRLGVGVDQSLLAVLSAFLEARIGKVASATTLSTLLEVGHLTDGVNKDIPIENVRRNLYNFRKRNPDFVLLIQRYANHLPRLVNPIGIDRGKKASP